MIDVADSNAVYYYHYDGSGSVVALSNSSGNSFQSYEYSAFGQVAASDPNFIANPYMYTGRRFDYETGLYYYRARYYNPYIGRFLQTDPIGYGDGINWYAYCGNNPVGRADPSGLYCHLYGGIDGTTLIFAEFHDCSGDLISVLWEGEDLDAWYVWAENENVLFDSQWMYNQSGFELWKNSPQGDKGLDERLFWEIQALEYLGIAASERLVDLGRWEVKIELNNEEDDRTGQNIIHWDRRSKRAPGYDQNWGVAPPLAWLFHEMYHAWSHQQPFVQSDGVEEWGAMAFENRARHIFWTEVPGWENLYPRPGYSKDAWGDFEVNAWTVWNYYSGLPGRNRMWFQSYSP